MIGSEVVQNPMPISMEESAVDASRVESEVSNQPASFNKATQYVKAGMQAQASGDAQALAKVNENILSDPEMHQLAHKNGKSLLSGDYSTLGSKDATRVREEESSAVGVPKNEVYRRATDALRRVQMAKNDQERSEAYAVLSADQDVNDFFQNTFSRYG